MALKMDDWWIGLLSIFRVDFGGLRDRQMSIHIIFLLENELIRICWLKFLPWIKWTGWLIFLFGILVLKRDIYVMPTEFCCYSWGCPFGFFHACATLAISVYSLGGAQQVKWDILPTSTNRLQFFVASNHQNINIAVELNQKKSPRTPINTHHIWNIKHLKHWTFRNIQTYV